MEPLHGNGFTLLHATNIEPWLFITQPMSGFEFHGILLVKMALVLIVGYECHDGAPRFFMEMEGCKEKCGGGSQGVSF